MDQSCYAMRIDVYTHYVKATKFDTMGKTALFEFAIAQGIRGWKPIGRGKSIQCITSIFAAATKDRSEFRFHINHYEALKRHLVAYDIGPNKIEEVHHGEYIPAIANFVKISDKSLFDYQVPLHEYFIADGKTKVVTLQTGRGKALTLDTPVKVPGGWKAMRHIREGDEVTSIDGTPTRVSGVYPQGVLPMYEVTFADGRTVECCPEHLWKVYYINTTPNRRWRVVDTREMLRLIEMPNPRVYIPLCEPEQSPAIDLPIHPYLLGVLIGDGALTGKVPAISSPDVFIVDKCRVLLPSGMRIKTRAECRHDILLAENGELTRNPLVALLKEADLFGKYSYEKKIPEAYLEASPDQRWELLQGLMDTDGTVNAPKAGGSVSYSTTSQELAEQVQYLVRSLGGIASISVRHSTYTHAGEKLEGRESYNVNIRMKTPSRIFTLPRKKERTNDDNQYAKDLKLRVTSIRAGKPKDAQCISVEHPDKLFVIKDFVVTHNTMLFLESVYKLKKRVLLIIRPKFIDKWILDFREMFKETDTSLAVIRGGAALSNMLQACVDGTFDVDFTIISNKTYQLWIKDWEHTRGSSGDYPLSPDMLCEATKAGVIAVDEVHLDFHLNFKMDLYTHGAKSMNMSATLVSGNPKITEMYQVKFPKLERSPEIEYDKYIAVTALSYTMLSQKGMRFKRSMGYSHTAFEESIMKDKERLRNYLSMIAGITKTTYVNRMVPGKKMLIFASTVEMCTLITKFISPMFPDQKVNRYVGEDDYADLHTADIVVSTIQSAGTAVDVDGLWVVLMTDSIDSIQSNLQVLGRLRKMKGQFLGVTPEFYYIFCNQIEKQVQYHMNKLEHFSGRVIGHRTLLTSYKV